MTQFAEKEFISSIAKPSSSSPSPPAEEEEEATQLISPSAAQFQSLLRWFVYHRPSLIHLLYIPVTESNRVQAACSRRRGGGFMGFAVVRQKPRKSSVGHQNISFNGRRRRKVVKKTPFMNRVIYLLSIWMGWWSFINAAKEGPPRLFQSPSDLDMPRIEITAKDPSELEHSLNE